MNRHYPKWIGALLSDDYEQAEGVLFDGEGYCCLGLAEKVCWNENFTQINIDGEREWEDESGNRAMLGDDEARLLDLHKQVTQADVDVAVNLGIPMDSVEATLVGYERQKLLASLNDAHVSLHRIGELLEVLVEENGWGKE